MWLSGKKQRLFASAVSYYAVKQRRVKGALFTLAQFSLQFIKQLTFLLLNNVVKLSLK